MNAREEGSWRRRQSTGSGVSDRSRRLWAATTVALLVAGVPLLASAAPAAAADSGVQLSLDGARWSSTLVGPLFADVRVVPGDVVDATLWVRNASRVTARLSIRVAEGIGTGADDLAGNLTLQVDGAPVTGGATWQGPLLTPGGQAVIPLAVTFDADATSGMLGASTVLDTVVLIEDPSAATGTAPGASGEPTTSGVAPGSSAAVTTEILATTGAEVRAVLVAALAAVGMGLLLVWRRRRRDDDDRVPATPES